MSQQYLCSENCYSDVLKREEMDIKVETPGVLWNSPLFSAEIRTELLDGCYSMGCSGSFHMIWHDLTYSGVQKSENLEFKIWICTKS